MEGRTLRASPASAGTNSASACDVRHQLALGLDARVALGADEERREEHRPEARQAEQRRRRRAREAHGAGDDGDGPSWKTHPGAITPAELERERQEDAPRGPQASANQR